MESVRLDVWVLGVLFALLGSAIVLLLGRLVVGEARTRSMTTTLARTAQVLEEIIETAPAGFVVFDQDGRIVRMNPALANTIGVDAAKYTGHRADLAFGAGVGPAIREAVIEVLTTGHAIPGQSFTLQTIGEPRSVIVSYFPVELEDFRLVGAVVVDVTARERYDRERERLLADESVARGNAERVASRLMRLQGITASLSTAKSSSLVAEVIMAEGMKALEVDSGNLATIRDDLRTLQIVATEGWDRTLQQQATFSIDDHHPLSDAARTQLGVYLESLDDLVARYPHLANDARRSERHSWAALPLVVSGRTLGAIGAAFSDDRPFDPERVAFLEAVAGQCAAALDRALTFDDARVLAQTLQRSLLPPALPNPPEVDFAAHFEPAGSAEVSGDFYDVFDMPDGGTWCATIGDVCGKGARAASMTSLARHTVRAAARHDCRPSSVLSELGEALRRDAVQRDLRIDESFATAAFVTIRRNGVGLRVELASGGHPLPLLVRKDARVGEVGRPGTLLGVLDRPDVHLVDDTVDLAPGDALVLYTDGLPEARGPDDFFGHERMLRAVAHRRNSAQEILADVVGAAMEFSLGVLRDDLAVLVIRAPDLERV